MNNELISILITKFKSDYQISNRQNKSNILNQLQQLTSLNRKHIIKLLSPKRDQAKLEKPGRPKIYAEELYDHIGTLHYLMEQISPKRMKEAIPIWLPYYEKHYGQIDEGLKNKIFKISSSTIGRIIQELRGNVKGLSSTDSKNRFKNLIPLKRLDEKVTEPGTLQADTVAHCGTSLLGTYANTLTVTDVYSGWTENRAMWTKEANQVKMQIIDIEKDIPLVIKNFDTDCGTEFLNYNVMKYFGNRTRPVQMRKARPYKKNDQCYVEQKNHTHVRNLFGYDRIENFKLVEHMNRIYKKYWNPLHNYFLPAFKLEEKVRIGATIKKKYGRPKTPAQRLLEVKGNTTYMKNKIKYDLQRLDPIALKKEVEKELNIFFKLIDQDRRANAA